VIASIGPRLDPLDRLGVELGERGRRVGDDGEDAGERPEPDYRDEDERVDQGVDAPEEIQHGAGRVEDRAGRDVPRREEPEGEGQGRGHRGSEERDLHRRQGAGQRCGKDAQVGWDRAPHEVEDPREPLDQAHGVGARVPDQPRLTASAIRST